MSKVTNKGQFSNQFRKGSTVTNPIVTDRTSQPKTIQVRKDIGYSGGNGNDVYVYRKPNANLDWSFTNGDRKKRCRRYGNLWLEFENEWRMSESEKQQWELYYKLKREFERGQRESTAKVEEATVKTFERKSVSECMAMNRHNEIVRLSCG